MARNTNKIIAIAQIQMKYSYFLVLKPYF